MPTVFAATDIKEEQIVDPEELQLAPTSVEVMLGLNNCGSLGNQVKSQKFSTPFVEAAISRTMSPTTLDEERRASKVEYLVKVVVIEKESRSQEPPYTGIPEVYWIAGLGDGLSNPIAYQLRLFSRVQMR